MSALLAAVDYLKDTDEHRQIGLCHWSLAEIAIVKGDYALSKQLYEQARASYRKAGWRAGEADCISGLATIADQTDDYAGAVALLNEAAAIFEQSASLRSQADCLWYIATAERVRERYTQASRLYETARSIYIAVGHQGGEADCLVGLAHVAIANGGFAAAREMLDIAKCLPRYDDISGDARWLQASGDLQYASGEALLAQACYKQAIEIFASTDNLRNQADCEFGLAAVAQLNGDYGDAEQMYHAAKQRYEAIGNLIGPANCLSALADLAFLNNLPEARRLNEQALQLFIRASAGAAAERSRTKRNALPASGQPA